MKPYEASFDVGSKVRVAKAEVLEEFRRRWKYHNPLETQQLQFAGKGAVVEGVGFYHGGDCLYVLRGFPGVWHEVCLEASND